MFDLGLGWSEILVVATVALIVVGPKDLPHLLRKLSAAGAAVRRAAGEFRSGLDAMAEESGIKDIKASLTDPELTRPFDETQRIMGSAAQAAGASPYRARPAAARRTGDDDDDASSRMTAKSLTPETMPPETMPPSPTDEARTDDRAETDDDRRKKREDGENGKT